MADPLKSFFDAAFAAFLAAERRNILNGTAERSLCARLMLQLEMLKHSFDLSEYYADCDFNRMQDGKIKQIIDEQFYVITVQCDVLFHGRGERGPPRENLIAIEMKKAGRPLQETLDDQKRLRALTTPPGRDNWSGDGKTFPEYVCGYELGLFIELDVQRATYRVEEYRDGNFVDAEHGTF